MSRMIRKRWLPRWICLLLAFPAFVFALIFSAVALRQILIVLPGWGDALFSEIPENIAILMLTSVATVAAYAVSKLVYSGFRWKEIEEDGVHCVHCEYNLTGNTSGVCPECGEPA